MKKYRISENTQATKLVKEQLAGYQRFNEFVKAEDRERLPKLTPEESARIYAELLSVWENIKE